MKKCDPTLPVSFSGVDYHHLAVPAAQNRSKSQEFLSVQEAFTLHNRAPLNFPRTRIVFVQRALNQFQGDLCDLQALASLNINSWL